MQKFFGSSFEMDLERFLTPIISGHVSPLEYALLTSQIFGELIVHLKDFGSWSRPVGSPQEESRLAVELEKVCMTHLCKLKATCWLLMSMCTST